MIIGSDSFRLLYLQSAVIRSGRQLDCMFLDTSAFAEDPGYVDFIRQNYPGFNLASILPATGNAVPSVDELPDLLKHLAAITKPIVCPRCQRWNVTPNSSTCSRTDCFTS